VKELLKLIHISAPANQESGHFSESSLKSGSGQISSRIWRMPVQRQYVQLIIDKTNAADLSSSVFAILISATRTKNIKSIAIQQISLKTGKH